MSRFKSAILGISAFGHDTSASLVDCSTWDVLYAIAEERLSNRKHDAHFPSAAITECIGQAEQLGYQIDEVAVNHRPVEFHGFLINEILTHAADRQRADLLIQFLNQLPLDQYYIFGGSASAAIDKAIADAVDNDDSRRAISRRFSWYFNWSVKHTHIVDECRRQFPNIPLSTFNHHLCHAETASEGSGYESCAVLVIDGQGESDTTSIYHHSKSKLLEVQKSKWPYSLGIFYLSATTHLGFNLGDEYKVMGMAAYGSPKFLPQLEPSFKVSTDGKLSFVESEFLAFRELPSTGHVVFSFTDRLHELLPQRQSTQDLEQVHFDFAASVQALTERVGVALASAARSLTGERRLALAGGVALNGLMNEKIRLHAGFEDVFVYPAAGDDGTSVGAALAALRKRESNKHAPKARLASCFYGGASSDEDIKTSLDNASVRYERPANIHETIANAITAGRIVARFNGHSEFGPRALGNRSILADPRNGEMRDILNRRIKQRESFRPFAPACLIEHVGTYFEGALDSPFMLLISKVKPAARADIPAVVHKDGTARLQSVARHSNPNFHATISEFYKKTGVPVLINTSFNVNGEAIVETAIDAIESFCFMDIDYLAIGPYWVDRSLNQHILPKLDLPGFLQRRIKRYENRYSASSSALDIGSFDRSFFPAQQ